MRVIDADLFIRWQEYDIDGNEIDCYGTVEDYLSNARTIDGQNITAEEIRDGQ